MINKAHQTRHSYEENSFDHGYEEFTLKFGGPTERNS